MNDTIIGFSGLNVDVVELCITRCIRGHSRIAFVPLILHGPALTVDHTAGAFVGANLNPDPQAFEFEVVCPPASEPTFDDIWAVWRGHAILQQTVEVSVDLWVGEAELAEVFERDVAGACLLAEDFTAIDTGPALGSAEVGDQGARA